MTNRIIVIGGDIFKFAGDAMIIIWPINEDKEVKQTDEYHRNTMSKAIQCGMNIQRELHDTSFSSGVTLSVKIGIGFGECKVKLPSFPTPKTFYFTSVNVTQRLHLSEELWIDASIWLVVNH